MKGGFRLKLFLASVGLILLALFSADLVLARSLEADMTAAVHEDAEVRLALLERDATSFPAPMGDLDAWDALADDLGARAHARVTVVRADGVVIGDSEVARADLASVESHAGRPEVRDALARGMGTSERRSDTVKKRMAYVAVPFRHEGAIAGVVRVATPLAEVDAAVARLHRTLLLASLGACLAVGLLSFFAAHWMARLVRALSTVARRMTRGELDARARLETTDELGELSRALDTLAGNLSEANAQLRGERDLLRGVLDEMQEGVLLLDRRGDITRVNPALRSMLLLEREVVGRPLLDRVRSAELKELIDAGRTETASGEIAVGGIRPRRLFVRVSKLPGDEGLLLAVFHDVTDVRRLETLRRDFVANVSHELRTPVTAIRSAAETLDGALEADPASAKRFLDIIERNAERLHRLIEDLLDLSRIESRELDLAREAIDLAAAVKHTLSLVRERAERQKVDLRAEVQAKELFGDRRALEQVLTNLVDNAVKYCPGATVTVRAALDADDPRSVHVRVEDTGPGIEGRHLARLFERFYRVDPGRSRELGGTGLGLSIVKHLVEAMGGSVTVTSRVGEGTSFDVVLPRDPASAPLRALPEAAVTQL